ncbi:ABC-type branched-subunit amino acid transport system substrate-binding protein [Hydrogenophaga palleronii]|uniref:ABC-type branched-subunit amino acid transport system substrate-binding protein n=1 Tax=Hydrogenophaga palleronii TaxID=65655 RepID=A0ABU1WRC5_9BURK|nr:ABC transporter substrate-binding protein [Hydrogenophaga palleronii]MDR7151863.1 ABC-type branched-subunit amino acid transport system substrate-binding protein [Hydrogenophaga palleronii]
MKTIVLALTAALALACGSASAQKKYDPGASDTTIRIGQTMPYSGAASIYGEVGKTQAAYFRMVNDQGGVNGRKIEFVSLDDGYSPPKTVEGVRKLVEQEEVLLLYGMFGTATNSAIHRYVNAKKIPHLLLLTGASKWNDPVKNPWSMSFYPDYPSEAKVYARQILGSTPNAKIAVLYQNDDYGRDYLKGFKEGLGAKAAAMIVAEASYELTDPTVDSQIVQLRGSGADVLVSFSTAKAAIQTLRKVHDTGWKPTHYLAQGAALIGAVFNPAGPEKATGVISTAYSKDPNDKQWENDAAFQDWLAFMKKYRPEADLRLGSHVYAYSSARLMVDILRASGDTLTRENVLKQAASIKAVQLPMFLPGVVVSSAPDDYRLIKSLQPVVFDGTRWNKLGSFVSID